MKKKILILVTALTLFCTGCGQKSTAETDGFRDTVMGKDALVEIGNGLWYDSATGIVYWWNGRLPGYTNDTTPSPYYASNGLPYRYDPETNTFEEIVVGE